MSQEKLLWNRCRTNNTDGAIEVLKRNAILDLMYNEGAVFKFAIQAKNITLLGSLLKYYQKQKLSGDKESIDYKKALFDLKKILEDAEESFEFSKEVKKALQPYFSSEEEDEQNNVTDIDYTEVAVFIHVGDILPQDYPMPPPDFCPWPEALSHQRHLSGQNGNGFSLEVH
jgi:hypothetical protein